MIGKKPSKVNLSHGIPLIIRAGISAVGPGKDSTSMLLCKHFLTIKYPGSEIPGEPASETTPIVSPFFKSSIIFLIFECSLNL